MKKPIDKTGTIADTFYPIIGEEGPLLERTKATMAWLLSPEANGIGEKLLRDAYALHKEPLCIYVTQDRNTAYLNKDKKFSHMLAWNPIYNDSLRHISDDGTLFTPSQESILAHELVHAGQPITRKEFIRLEKVPEAVGRRLNNSKEGHALDKAFTRHMEDAKNAAYQSQANESIRQAVEVLVTSNKMLDKAEHEHPDYIDWVNKYETQAVAAEREVARLRGEPQRANYTEEKDYSSFSIKNFCELQEKVKVKDKIPDPPLVSSKHPLGFWENLMKDNQLTVKKLNTR